MRPDNNAACNDYAQYTVKTGAALIAKPSNDVTGSDSVKIFEAVGNTLIRSIIIKARKPTTTDGMVRIFIGTGTNNHALYREVPIPKWPHMDVTPIPLPPMPSYGVMLEGTLKLSKGFFISASTVTEDAFSIIVEAMEWKYPDPLPPACCSYVQETASTGTQMLTGGTAPAAIFTNKGDNNGTLINSITVTALQSTHEGLINLYVSDGKNMFLMKQVEIPYTNRGDFNPAFTSTVLEDYYLANGYQLSMSADTADQSYAVNTEAVSFTYPDTDL